MYKAEKIKNAVISYIESQLDVKAATLYSDSDRNNSVSEIRLYSERDYFQVPIPEARSWRIGIWSSKVDKDSWKVNVFFEHEWYIDKFKPTGVVKNTSFIVTRNQQITFNDGVCDPLELWSIVNEDIRMIVKHPIESIIKYYWYGSQGMFAWIVSQSWYYKVVEPLRAWWNEKGIKPLLGIIALMYKIKFGSKIKVSVEHTPEYFSPKHIFRVTYFTEVDSDEDFRLWCKINTEVVKNRDGERSIKYRNLFMGGDAFRYVDLENVHEGDRRGFSYNVALSDDAE